MMGTPRIIRGDNNNNKSDKTQCVGINKGTGKQCGNWLTDGSTLCSAHQNNCWWCKRMSYHPKYSGTTCQCIFFVILCSCASTVHAHIRGWSCIFCAFTLSTPCVHLLLCPPRHPCDNPPICQFIATAPPRIFLLRVILGMPMAWTKFCTRLRCTC